MVIFHMPYFPILNSEKSSRCQQRPSRFQGPNSAYTNLAIMDIVGIQSWTKVFNGSNSKFTTQTRFLTISANVRIKLNWKSRYLPLPVSYSRCLDQIQPNIATIPPNLLCICFAKIKSSLTANTSNKREKKSCLLRIVKLCISDSDKNPFSYWRSYRNECKL